MFTSAKAYIVFFQSIQDYPKALIKGEIPKFSLVKPSPLNCVFIIVGGYLFSPFVSLFLAPISDLVILAVPLMVIGYLAYFGGLISLAQLNYYILNHKHTSLNQVINHNLSYIANLTHIPYLQQKFSYTSAYTEKLLDQPASHLSSNDFTLFLGTTTGLLAKLWHISSLTSNQHVLLDLNDASKNILVLGGIGTGKTTTIMQPLLLQLLHQGYGGLIFDIKGDVKNTTLNLVKSTNRHIRVLGPSRSKLNILAGITPETSASFLKSVFLLNSGDVSDRFWIDTATELSRNTLGLLSFLPEFYTLHHLYRYIFDPEAHSSLEEQLAAVQETLSPDQKRLFNSYHQYQTSIFDHFDDKIKSGVKATLAQTLSPFNHPDFIDAFCSKGDLNIERILDGDVFLINMPIATWGLGAKVAYTFIKLRFYNLMQKNHNAAARKLPVFFMCDEFQEIVSCNRDGLSDLNFWDKARSSKTIGIISAQSIASFFATTPNRDYAYALLQNFRNKICLPTEDPLTLDYLSKVTGQAKSHRRSLDQAGNISISEARDSVLEAQIFRSLPQNSALALLTINNISSDDVLKLYPLYVEDLAESDELGVLAET